MYKQTNLLFVLLLLTIYISTIKCSKIFNKKQQQLNTIYLNEKASKNLRLRSVLNVNINDLNSISNKKLSTQSPSLASTPATVKTNKIYWSFKRLYTLPRFNSTNTQNELSLTESMISLDNEVQENLKDKFIISQTKNSEFDLIINNLTYADSGIYKCNLWNQKTIYYHLIVTSPIQRPDIFVEKLDSFSSLSNAIDSSSKMILESSNVTLKCISKYAYPYPSFNWFQNNKQITALTPITHLVDKEINMIESILHINNIDSSFHMSNFTCKLMQLQFDEIDYTTDNYKDQEQLWQQSETVTLNVAFKPIVNIQVKLNNGKNYSLKSSSNRIILYDDSDIDFECKYKSNPVDSVQVIWKLDDINQNDFNDKNVFNWLKRTNRFDLYKRPLNLTCQVGNSIGFGSFSYEIELIYEPRINLENRIYEIDEFSQLKINCSVVSSPEAHIIEWRKYETGSPSSILINNIENYKVVSNRSILEFKSIKHNENAGYYVCIAINSMNDSFGQYRLGQKYVKIEVNVRFRPQINMIAKKVAANLTNNGKHTLNCMTMANPEPTFQWFRNGIRLNANSSKYLSSNVRTKSKNLFENSLIINDLNMDDLNKVYECEASNQLGSNRLDIELVPLSKPEKPSELRTLFVNFMMITLGWSSGFDGGLEQEFYIQLNDSIIDFKNESILKLDSKIEIIKSGPSLVNFTNLTPDTTYSIRIMSKNKLGSSGWTDYINVKTNRIDSKDSNLLPIFDSLFFNVPKNRLEFTIKKDTDVDAYIQSLIPICLNVSASLENQFLRQLHFDQCLNVENFANINTFSFDSLNDLILNDKITQFEPKKVKSIKVSICYQMNRSICNLMPTTAIIDTYNKISPLNKNSNENNGLSNLVSTINLSQSLTNKSKTIPLALIIGICVCILSLLVLLFVTVIYCIRKRNIKLCKSLLSQTDAVKSLKNSSSSSSSGNSDSTESSNTNTTSRHSQDCTDLAKVAAMSAIKTEFERKMAAQNKTFQNIDISSISAPLAYKTITSSTNDIINSHNILLSNSMVGGTITATNKRTFTAALTATANNIIGKHKSMANNNNEIMVTEDDEKGYKLSKNNKSPSDTCSNPSSVDESKIIDQGSHPTSSAASTTSSSNTSSTAVSSSHNHNVNTGGYLFTPSEYNSSFQNSNDLANQYHQNNGITFIDTFNSGVGSSASNTDPIAINNSISSSHSTTNTDSPTYNYNVTSATLNNNHHQDGSILYIKSTLNSTSVTNSNSNNLYQVQLDESSNYTKNTIKSKNSIYNNSSTARQLINDQTESGYSTPSRHKKVVYEVIV